MVWQWGFYQVIFIVFRNRYHKILLFCIAFVDLVYFKDYFVFSSPEPKAHGRANSKAVTPASVRQHFQTSSLLKSLGHLNSNFIWRLLRTHSNSPGHMTKMAADKNPLKIFSRTRIYLNIVFLQAFGPIELKFHVKTPYDKLAYMYTKYFVHMTKMAATPIYGKNPLKIFFSRTRRPVTLGLGM